MYFAVGFVGGSFTSLAVMKTFLIILEVANSLNTWVLRISCLPNETTWKLSGYVTKMSYDSKFPAIIVPVIDVFMNGKLT